MQKKVKIPFAVLFSVGAVQFSAHAGGGFATGNQAHTYYVGLGWLGPLSAIGAMLLLTITMREAMLMYNSRGLTSYKELFQTLYHPFDKLYLLFEVFFYIMVLMAVAAAISGAASALTEYFGLNYYLGIVLVGLLVLCLTIFGADLVRMASTYMGIAILVTAVAIYAVGIAWSGNLQEALWQDFTTQGFGNVPQAILNCFTYAGFQCVTLPTMIACGTPHHPKGLFPLHVALLWDERGGPGAFHLHASLLAGVLHLGGGGDSHPHPDGVPGDGHGLADGGVRRVPAAVPDLHRGDHHLRLCGPV